MYKVYVFDMESNKLFDYETNVLPIPGDTYCNTSHEKCPGHYEVIKRILHTEKDLANVISIRATKISEAVI